MGEVTSLKPMLEGWFQRERYQRYSFAVQSFVTLFVIMDPPGATPIFLRIGRRQIPKDRRILAVQAAGVSLLVISIFALFGERF